MVESERYLSSYYEAQSFHHYHTPLTHHKYCRRLGFSVYLGASCKISDSYIWIADGEAFQFIA